MDQIGSAIQNVKAAAQTYGLSALAREADLPYTTVKSFADRDWSHKNLDTVRALIGAADRLSATKAA